MFGRADRIRRRRSAATEGSLVVGCFAPSPRPAKIVIALLLAAARRRTNGETHDDEIRCLASVF
jgi:hypothetical protein